MLNIEEKTIKILLDNQKTFQDIINTFYKVNIDGTKITDMLTVPEDSGHVSRVAFLATQTLALYKKHKPDLSTDPIDGDLEKKISIAAMFHDSATGGDDASEELSSGLLYLSYVIEKNICTPKEAIFLCHCLVMKNADRNENQMAKLQDFLNNKKH